MPHESLVIKKKNPLYTGWIFIGNGYRLFLDEKGNLEFQTFPVLTLSNNNPLIRCLENVK